MKTLFVNGTLMRGLELHGNLKGATFLGEARTTPHYRLYSINDVHPGMFRLDDGELGGISVPGEVYDMSDEVWGVVSSGEAAGLYDGPVTLEDGRTMDGIQYPRDLAEANHKDISDFGGWRNYIATLSG